jgi:hypothetical protein
MVLPGQIGGASCSTSVVSPATVTGQLLAGTLATAAGVQNVVVQAGSARRPDGDAAQFDVRDEAADPVLGRCVTSALIAPG